MNLPRFSERGRYLLQETVLILGCAYLFMLSGTNSNFVNPRFLFASVVLISFVTLLWLAAGQRAATPLARPWLAWTAAFAISTALSVDAWRSINQMILMLVGIFLFALSADLAARGWPRALIVRAVMLAGGVVVVLQWVDAFGWYRSWLALNPGAWIPEINYRPISANVVAMVANLTGLLALGSLRTARRPASQAGLGLLAVASLGMLYLTSSRGGWLGFFVGGAVLLGLELQRSPHQWKTLWRRISLHKGWLLGLAVLGAAGLLLFGWLVVRQMIHPTHSWSFMARWEYWQPAWRAFLSSPLVGVGPFTYGSAFLTTHSIPPMILFIHPHSMLFLLLAENGLIGLAAAGWLVWAIAQQLWRGWKSAGEDTRGIFLGVGAAGVALLVHGFFDCFHTEPLALWGWLIALGAVLGQPAPSVAAQSRPRHAWWTLGLVGALWVGQWMAQPLIRGIELGNSGNWQAAAAAFDLAVWRDPTSTLAFQQSGLTQAILAEQGSPQALEAAVYAYRQTVERDPAWALNHANLGVLYASQGNLTLARVELEASVQRAPNCAICYLNLGAVLELSGEVYPARQAYQQALTLAPDWRNAYFWRSTPLSWQARDEWDNAHPLQKLSLEELRAQAHANLQYQLPLVQLVEAELEAGHLEEAERWLRLARTAFEQSPLDGLEVAWANARLAAANKDWNGAAVQGERALQGYLMQGVRGPGSFGQLHYASLLFRRPALAVELVPQLKLISLPDEWGQRMADLAVWYDQAGQPEQAKAARQRLYSLIPDWDVVK